MCISQEIKMSQQWEYCVLTSRTDMYPERTNMNPNFFGSSGQITYDSVEWGKAISQLGVAGWERTGIAFPVVSSASMARLYFKRPIEPGRAIDDAL
jgi:hypothetical protein